MTEYGPHEKEVDLFGAASLHETTVQQAEDHAAQHKPKKITVRQPKKVLDDYAIKVDPRVMNAARRLAGGDMRRIEIVSATEVLVR